MNKAKRSAAARKAWRTRKRMERLRIEGEKIIAEKPWLKNRRAELLRLKKLIKSIQTWITPGQAITFGNGPGKTTVLIIAEPDSIDRPEYKRDALPLPEFGKWEK